MNPQNGSNNNSAFDLSDSSAHSSDANLGKGDNELTQELEGKRTKNVLFGLLFGFLGVLIVAGFFVADPLGLIGSDDDAERDNTEVVATDQSGETEEEDVVTVDPNEPVLEQEWWQEEETKYPVMVEDWTTKSYSEYLSEDALGENGEDGEGNEGEEGTEGEDPSTGNNPDDRNQLYPRDDVPESVESLNEYIAGSTIGSHLESGANALPSEAAGYTSDFSKMVLSDGSLNPMFSAWTKETFNVELQKSITRFINPEFGGWASAQYSSWPRSNDSVLVNRMADMFTADYLTEHEGDPVSSYLPIFADWNNNDYGMGDVLLNPGPRWFGVVQDATLDFNRDSETGKYTAKVVANVKYTAWTQDQSKVEKFGTLTLNVVQPTSQRTHYLVFDQADLNME